MGRNIYMDYAATTPLDKKVVLAMKNYWSKNFGNPSSIHKMGVEAKNILEESRKKIADFINGHSREIIFTSGGTEANNLAILGVIKRQREKNPDKKIHLITTNIEHSSVLECFKELEKEGCEVSYLEVNQDGQVNPKDLRKLIKPETVFISVGYANSEIGVIQPIKEIIKEIRYIRKDFGRERFALPYFHIDASQAGQYLNMNVEELGIDLLTLDAQKMYGPKGIGALFIRDGVEISPLILGGGQENGLRAGTENIPLIVGFSKAVDISAKIKEKENSRLIKLRDGFFEKIKKNVRNVVINGHLENRLPNNINISIPGQDGEMLVLRLDEFGITSSSASACASGSGESYVVKTISKAAGLSDSDVSERAKSTLRFSLGRDTKIGDIIYLLKIIKKLINI